MRILALSAHAVADTQRVIGDWRLARARGVQVSESLDGMGDWPDAIVGMSISRMRDTWIAINRYPSVPFYAYMWDAYSWVWERPRAGEYDYREYGKLLGHAREIWVPSVCTGVRTKQWWGYENWRVVLSSVPYWDWPDVGDDGYALCTLREIPDRCWGWFARACEELGIPYRMTQHQCSFAEYQRVVARCRFLCSPLEELSTGGLTLLEGYRLGKPCLLSDSPWHGGADYLGNRATYFDHRNYLDFRRALQEMHERPPAVPDDARHWVENRYNAGRMIEDMLARIQATL